MWRSMPLRIYQAYFQGPHALFQFFEDAFGRQCASGLVETELKIKKTAP